MSTSLKYKVVKPDDGEYLDPNFKHVFRRLTGHDPVNTTFESSDIPYLEGMKCALTDAGMIKTIEALIEHLENGNTLKIYEER